MTEEAFTQDEMVGRRRFLAGIIGFVAAVVSAIVALPAIVFIVAPGAKKTKTERWVTLGPLSLLTPGVPYGFPYSFSSQDGWVESTQSGVAWAITHDGSTVRVLSDVCTHLSCRVDWKPDQGAFVCPCHAGYFNGDGFVLSGPPPRPLDEFQSEVEGGQIRILLEA